MTEKLTQKLSTYFEEYPSHEECFTSSDEFIFHKDHTAKTHAASLEDKAIGHHTRAEFTKPETGGGEAGKLGGSEGAPGANTALDDSKLKTGGNGQAGNSTTKPAAAKPGNSKAVTKKPQGNKAKQEGEPKTDNSEQSSGDGAPSEPPATGPGESQAGSEKTESTEV